MWVHGSLLKEGWLYIKNLVKNINGYSSERIIKLIPAHSELHDLSGIKKHKYYKLDGNIEVALLYNDETSIFAQLCNLIPAEDINIISVVSPYYDENGESLINLIHHFINAKLEAYLPKQFGLPPTKIEPERRIEFYEWENTLRAQNMITGAAHLERRLQSKIFQFNSGELNYCLIGSANATKAGLGTLSQRGINDEFCILYKTNKRDILSEIGITGDKFTVNPALLVRGNFNTSENIGSNITYKRIFINSIDLTGLKLEVFINNSTDLHNADLIIFNDHGEPIYKESLDSNSSNSISINIDKEVKANNPCYALIQDISGDIISNKQIINNVDKLYNTDPSKSNRYINRIISDLIDGKFNEFNLIDYLNELHSDKNETSTEFPLGHSCKNSETNESDNTSSKTYFEAKLASKDARRYYKIQNTHNSVRIMDIVIDILNQKRDIEEDELMEEEEEGKPNVGKDRIDKNTAVRPIIIRNIKEGDIILNKVTKLANSYLTNINKLKFHAGLQLDSIDLVEFLLVTYILTKVSFNTKYDFSEKKDEEPFKFRLKNIYADSMKEILTCFTQLFIKNRINEFKEDEIENLRFNGYLERTVHRMLLYIYLIYSHRPDKGLVSEMEIIALNIFEYLGRPDSDFESYVINFSQNNDEVNFNATAMLHLYKSFKDAYNREMLNFNDRQIGGERFFKISHSGVCLILDKGFGKIKYRSVYGTATIGNSQFKKYLMG